MTQTINSFHQADHVRPRVASSVEDAAPETTRPSAAPETSIGGARDVHRRRPRRRVLRTDPQDYWNFCQGYRALRQSKWVMGCQGFISSPLAAADSRPRAALSAARRCACPPLAAAPVRRSPLHVSDARRIRAQRPGTCVAPTAPTTPAPTAPPDHRGAPPCQVAKRLSGPSDTPTAPRPTAPAPRAPAARCRTDSTASAPPPPRCTALRRQRLRNSFCLSVSQSVCLSVCLCVCLSLSL